MKLGGVHRVDRYLCAARCLPQKAVLSRSILVLCFSLATLLSSCTNPSGITNSPETGKPQTGMTVQPVTASASANPENKTSETKTQEVKIGELKLGETKIYTYKTGLFQIDIPKNWTVKDISSPKQVAVIWVNPSHTIVLGVQINVNSKANGIPSKEELAQVLPAIVRSNFGSRPNFELTSVPPEPDRAPRVIWSYKEGQGSVRGFSDIQQDGDKLSVLSAGILEKNATKESIAAMVKIFSTYKVDPIISISEP
ncbi:hypothetical protein TUMEXPCC7403_15275 [Tumidithrix helvetica PCC 7403]|uniref:hypothetical protein n=1 Tax=Tumidithrix helvetica TaxID=3457545 RepID=UPI003CBB7D4A